MDVVEAAVVDEKTLTKYELRSWLRISKRPTSPVRWCKLWRLLLRAHCQRHATHSMRSMELPFSTILSAAKRASSSNT